MHSVSNESQDVKHKTCHCLHLDPWWHFCAAIFQHFLWGQVTARDPFTTRRELPFLNLLLFPLSSIPQLNSFSLMLLRFSLGLETREWRKELKRRKWSEEVKKEMRFHQNLCCTLFRRMYFWPSKMPWAKAFHCSPNVGTTFHLLTCSQLCSKGAERACASI